MHFYFVVYVMFIFTFEIFTLIMSTRAPSFLAQTRHAAVHSWPGRDGTSGICTATSRQRCYEQRVPPAGTGKEASQQVRPHGLEQAPNAQRYGRLVVMDDDRNIDLISEVKDGGAAGFLWIELFIHSLIHLDANLDRYETDSVMISLHDSDEEAHCC